MKVQWAGNIDDVVGLEGGCLDLGTVLVRPVRMGTMVGIFLEGD
jgi:hypothetical protein